MGCSQEKITGSPLGDGEIPRAGGESNGVNVTRRPEEVHSLNPEAPNPASVEVRFGDPEVVDAPRLHELFTDPTTVEHLQGIVPSSYEEEYRQRDPETGKEEVRTRTILATTVDGIREEYRGNPNLILLTAEDPSGHIAGACTVEKNDINVGVIGRLVVDKDYRGIGERGERVVDKLIRAAIALICREGSGGLDCRVVRANVIISEMYGGKPVHGYERALNVLRRWGFEIKGQSQGGTISWSEEQEKLVHRDSVQMELTRKDYIQDFPDAHVRDFPKPRPLR